MTLRAEVIDTKDQRVRAGLIIINAPAQKIFNVLANPELHSVFDGSESVKGVISAPDRLHLGAKFGMAMKLGVKYRITNEVVKFEEGKSIAWRHLGRWVWGYEIRQISPNQSEVIESFDGRVTKLNWWLKLRKAYPSIQIAILKTLVRLKQHCEA